MFANYSLMFILFASLLSLNRSNTICDDQTCNKCLSNLDFQSSSFVISESGKYCFSENIVLDANANTIDHAILITAVNVEIDLKTFSLSQSEANVYRNRIFSLISIRTEVMSTNNPPQQIYIHDGKLGRSSMFGILGTESADISLENLQVSDFEIAGISLTDCIRTKVINVSIGPSSDNVKASGYYLSALRAKKALDDIELTDTNITFSGNRIESLQTIYDNLDSSINLAYDLFISDETDDNMNNYSFHLFTNPLRYPDYALLRGIDLQNCTETELENIVIRDLKHNANEIPGTYFSSNINDSIDVLRVNDDVLDLRSMVSYQNGWTINLNDPLQNIEYLGNPLSDAQVALALTTMQTQITDSDNSLETFLVWALESDGNMQYLPQDSTYFECYGDILDNERSGIIGLNILNSKHTKMENIMIEKLTNKSPIPPYSCHTRSYETKSTDVKGINVINSEVLLNGFNNVIEKLISYSGDVVALMIDNGKVEFDYVFDVRSSIRIWELCSGHDITFALLAEMMVDNQYPENNQFYACNIKIANGNDDSLFPNPPNGVKRVYCAQNIPNHLEGSISDVLPVEFITASSDSIAIELTSSVSTSSPESTSTETISVNGVGNAAKQDPNQPIAIKNEFGRAFVHHRNDDIYSNRPYLHLALTIFGLTCVVCTVFLFCMRYYNSYQKKKLRTKKAYIANKASYTDNSDDSDDSTDQELISP